MADVDRMYRVIVVGGFALAATAPAVAGGCGGTVAPSTGFPIEGAQATDAAGGSVDAFPTETATQIDAFPQEGPPYLDAGSDAARIGDATSEDAFPQEGPPYLDAGFDAVRIIDATSEDAFPHEGPNLDAGHVVIDAGHADTGSSVADASPDGPGFPSETASWLGDQ
jgi:hypothetical protein